MICSFPINDNIYKHISNMANNLIPYNMAIGEENIYFPTPHLKFVKRDRIDDSKLLNTDENSVEPFVYHCAKNLFKKITKI